MSSVQERMDVLTRDRERLQMLHTVEHAHALIRDPKNWTRRQNACGRFGFSCSPYSSRAVSMCGQGAVYRAAKLVTGSRSAANVLGTKVLTYISQNVTHQVDLHHINDEKVGGHKIVLAVFERTRAKLAA